MVEWWHISLPSIGPLWKPNSLSKHMNPIFMWSNLTDYIHSKVNERGQTQNVIQVWNYMHDKWLFLWKVNGIEGSNTEHLILSWHFCIYLKWWEMVLILLFLGKHRYGRKKPRQDLEHFTLQEFLWFHLSPWYGFPWVRTAE